MGENKQIFILTNFSQYLKSYSPIIVVQSQLEMFLSHGYNPVLITDEAWDVPEDSIFSRVRTIRLPHVVIDGTVVDEAFERDVDKLYEELKTILPENAIVITHDLIFLPDYVKHNVACRRLAAERSSIQWLHWIHSATSPGKLIEERAMFGEKYKQHLSERFPNSVVCFPNSFDIPRVARNYNYEEDQVLEVPHATDLTEILSPRFKRLYDEKRLGDKEVLMCYPLRLDRGKQAECNVKFIAACKREGTTAHVVFCDFQSTGDDKVVYREDLKKLARELGIENDVTFMSEFDESAQMEVAHQEILLFQFLCNVFMLPSISETYSLVAQEAMGAGNFCILNHDFPPMQRIYGKNAIYRQFSGSIGFDGFDGSIDTTHQPEENYYTDIARAVKYYLENDKVLRGKTWVRVYRNHSYVFKHFVEPILNKEDQYDEEEPEVLGDIASVLGAGTDTGGSEQPTPLPRQNRSESNQVDNGSAV